MWKVGGLKIQKILQHLRLRHIMKLQHLHLGSNGLKSVAKSSEDFSPLTSLTSLDLSRNSIQVIVINIKICMMSIIVLIFSFPWPPCRQTTTKTLTQYFVPCTTCFDHMIMIITWSHASFNWAEFTYTTHDVDEQIKENGDQWWLTTQVLHTFVFVGLPLLTHLNLSHNQVDITGCWFSCFWC